MEAGRPLLLFFSACSEDHSLHHYSIHHHSCLHPGEERKRGRGREKEGGRGWVDRLEYVFYSLITGER